jgi:hypothetical protein
MDPTGTYHVHQSQSSSSHDASSLAAPMSSPVSSVFSKGHMSKSSTSSLSVASSPVLRDSFDLFGPKLGRVTEEQEREETALDPSIVRRPSICKYGSTPARALSSHSLANDYSLYFASESQDAPHTQDSPRGFTVGEHGDYSTTSLDHYHFKRQKSGDSPAPSLHHRLSSRLGSMSRRLRARSGAGPQLSIVTHTSAPVSRAGSVTSAHFMSPAMSAISKHESYLPPSPAQETMNSSMYEEAPMIDEDMQDVAADQPQATTPLLPPVFTEQDTHQTVVQSPLQSPSIAPTAPVVSSRTSIDAQQLAGLPSPPLSTKPSIVSMHQRSRTNTGTTPLAEIPPLQLISEDPWSHALGHNDFNIHPEPYLPEVFDVESYTEFRKNWDHARRNYAKVLHRAIENSGPTSRVCKLTEEKWASIDKVWKQYYQELDQVLGPQLKRISDRSQSGTHTPSVPLEKPASRVIMPEIDDKCGKFPELGDCEIVGPMEVAPPRSSLATPSQSPTSPRKRTLLRFLSDMLGKT